MIDPGRAARAAIALSDGDVRIVPDPIEPGVYAVSSFSDDRTTYRVAAGPDGDCTCADATYNGAVCKHRIATALFRELEGAP